jgi:hypothetical protein
MGAKEHEASQEPPGLEPTDGPPSLLKEAHADFGLLAPRALGR